MQNFWNNTQASMAIAIPNILGALLVLVVGTVVAWLVAAVVRWLMGKTSLDDKLLGWTREDGATPSSQGRSERWAGRIVFWLIMLFVLAAFFDALDVPAVSGPIGGLLQSVVAYIPRLFAALLLLAVAWLVAKGVKILVTRGLTAARVDERINQHLAPKDASADYSGTAATSRVSLAKTLGDTCYWLVFLLFLPMILDALNLQGILRPVTEMLEQVLAFLPNLFLAIIILVVGWFVARIVRRLVEGVLAAVGVDRFVEESGIARAMGRYSVSSILAWVLYVLILLPVIIMALEALHVDTITQPATTMLNKVMAAIPNIFAAALLLVIAYVVGRLVANVLSTLLDSFGVNRMLSDVGLIRSTAPASSTPVPVTGGRHLLTMEQRPTDIIGKVILVALMLFATAEALRLIGFIGLAGLVLAFLDLLGRVILGLVIIALGLAIAQFAARVVRESKYQESATLATIARVSITILAIAMGLKQMGIADTIINLAFGLALGSVAVAAAIAFGMGGRDAAKRQVERWSHRFERPEIMSGNDVNLPSIHTPPPSGTTPANPGL